MPKLIITKSDGSEVTHELGEDQITIGRLPDNMLQIEDGSVSSHHAQLTVTGGDYFLQDLNSTNGTRVNGQNTTEAQLQDGDKVRFGQVEAVYTSEIPSEAQPLPEVPENNLKPAESSRPPADFANASPFKTKKKKKDPTGKAVLAFAILSILAFVGALFTVFSLQPPQ